MPVRGNEAAYEASGYLVLITLLPRISTSSSSKLSLGALRKESPDVSLSVEELTEHYSHSRINSVNIFSQIIYFPLQCASGK